ncbi:MAG: hypothetical protein AMK69_09685 [Nitrospira bacterium SG8_3]|nr:MAG: hypothetical protein AMK69_09685 [Nitrospira bacterium SG8_3]
MGHLINEAPEPNGHEGDCVGQQSRRRYPEEPNRLKIKMDAFRFFLGKVPAIEAFGLGVERQVA